MLRRPTTFSEPRGYSYVSGEGANEVRFYPALALLLGRVSMSSFPCALSGAKLLANHES